MLTSIWVNDIEIKLIEDYKSAEEVIYVFIDSLSETIDESKIKRGENIGFNVYFKKITYE